ncbi:MAG: retroviral-like aspartic protease family protein [Sphingomonadaceae bacterium]|nr:retroviral-like aspartic protease family protein [Sphingomonadaceae bacterium]
MPPVPFSLATAALAALAVAQVVPPRAAPLESSAAVAPHEIERANDRLFYVTAEIDGAPIRMLVDTGASVSVLTRADANRLGLAADRRGESRIDTVGGRVAMAWTTLDRVRIGAHRLRRVRAAIVDGGPGVSLIGQDILSEFASIRFDGDRMRLD